MGHIHIILSSCELYPISGLRAETQRYPVLVRNVPVFLVRLIQLPIQPYFSHNTGIPLGLGAGFKLKDKEKEGLQEVEPPTAPSNSYGWTAILEDWYSHAGSAHVVDRRRGFRNVPGIPNSPISSTTSMPDLKRRKSVKPPPERKGPYELLIKERMMGLYLAIYIHRDIKHLVRGKLNCCLTSAP